MSKKYTFEQIARKLGMTKNAVAGLVFRLKKKGLIEMNAKKPRVSQPSPKTQKPVLKKKKGGFPTDRLPPAIPPMTWSRSGQCQFIYGDPAQPGWQMCGNPVSKGCRHRIWCDTCLPIIYQPVQPAQAT